LAGGLSKSEETASCGLLFALFETWRTDHLHWPLPAHRRGSLRGMDAV